MATTDQEKLSDDSLPLETHPWAPFIPADAKVLIMGTFPPGAHRWAMNFYYPNRTNDFWPMMGIIFFGNRDALLSPDRKNFDLPAIKELLSRKGIAMNDTGHRVRRLKGNASDKFLEIVEPVDLFGLLKEMPKLTDIVTTGEKAADVIALLTETLAPKMGEYVEWNGIRIWRMPSTSRAYPLALDKKAAYYSRVFESAGLLGR